MSKVKITSEWSMYHFGTKPFISRSSHTHLSCKSPWEIISKRLHICRYRFDLPTKNIFYLFFRWNPDLVPTYSSDYILFCIGLEFRGIMRFLSILSFEC